LRALGIAAAIALTLVAGSAAAVDSDVPTRQDVQEAKVAARDKERDVAAVQADLVVANQRLQQSSVRAAQAAEAWNGARYELQQARKEAAAAERRSGIAQADVDRQRDAYADAIATSYQLSPGLSGFGAMAQADGIEDVIDKATTMRAAESALDGNYDQFRASSTLADVATAQAQAAREKAMDLQVKARAARDAARAAEAAAANEAASIAAQKDELIAEMAQLQDISVRLAERRQSALEAQAAAAAAAAAEAEAQEQAEQATQEAQQQPQQQPQHQDQHQDQQPDPGPQNDDPAPQDDPPPSPPPSPPSPPAPSGGVGAAIAFARAQIGEPYRWGAAGPSSWDCSGLTMGAWQAGGRYLPHYSVAQYEQSTPISPGSLQPGDLVFWGSSSSPSSIYHVALYVGGGQMIHAPRTGRPVTQESMYYWIPPNFYARP
jgi:cell wall-associated NlpC family hydrolase